MAPYRHHINTHHRARTARRLKKGAQVSMVIAAFIGLYIAGDWLVTTIRSSQTVVSTTSSATVQSAQINIFQSPYFRFQADASWREVSDELNLAPNDNSLQYLYRSFDGNFIEHELLVTVNLPDSYKLARHNIPTRVMPVRIEQDGSLTQLAAVSAPCAEVLPEENPNFQPHTLTQNDITYYCNPNQVNDYTVTLGVPGQTNKLLMPHAKGEKSNITITYRNITPTPDASMFERIVREFKSL